MANVTYARFRYERRGFTFTVYPDHVRVTSRRRLSQTITIHPLAHIAQVVVHGAPARLHIEMDDGSTAAYELIGHAVAAHDAIQRLLVS